MATNFPTSLDSFTNPSSSSTLDSPSHAAQHANINDAVEAIEAALLDGAPLHIDDANERVGIGTTAPADMMDVGDSGNLGSFRVHASGGLESFRVAGNVVRSYNIYNLTIGSAANVYIASNSTMYRSTSSSKYKTDVETLDDEHADIIFQLRPVWFRSTTGNDPDEWSYYGLIAEEVAEVDPRLVHFGASPDCQCEPDEDGHVEHVLSCLTEPEGVQYDRLVPHLISVVQRQQAQIDALEARLTALEKAP